MEEVFLPVLSHFQNGNAWTGSGGRLRYRLVPESVLISAAVWEGPFCYELSAAEEKREFPMTEEGLEEIRTWLLDWGGQINTRPPKSLDETLEMRKQPQDNG